MTNLKVNQAAAGDTIEIKCAGVYDPDSARYVITLYQDLKEKVRARANGGNIVYLHNDNLCRIVKDGQTGRAYWYVPRKGESEL
tara:strand:+ start:55 stop:306 length:252 start_codon:yes stop_codon:yes gene_type:complete